MKKHLLLICLLILALSPLACFSQEPNVPTQNLNVAGLKEKVTIRRDERGIPYIEARNETDLYFAQGFITAQDRLWQMDLLRRVARGELSEIFGRQNLGGVTTVDEDKRWRKYGFAQIAADSLQYLAPETRRALDAYTSGVNAYLASLDQKSLPIEFQILQYRPREWRADDSIVIGKILADGLSSTWQMDLRKAALADLPEQKRAELFRESTPYDVLLIGKDSARKSPKAKIQDPISGFSNSTFDELAKAEEVRQKSLELVGLYAEDLAASNNWVISGKRTADGKPILANDPHLQAAQPPIWYLTNLSAPNFHVAGVTVPGALGVILGHNERIAWGATNVGPDVQDLYLEKFDPANSRRYQTPTGFQEADVRREEIKIRKNALNPQTESEFLEVTRTRNGVVFFEDAGKKYSLKWTAFDPKNNEFEAFFLLNRVTNWEDFKAALKGYGGPMQNFVYADSQGNIGWYAAGRVPLRKNGDGSVPYDGATDAGEWTGFVPFEELPNLYNPPDGLIVTANQRTVGETYKYKNVIARDVAAPFRARRIYDLLSANQHLTVENVRDVQHDTFNIAVSRFAREVVNLRAASENTLKLLSGWDGRMNADSKAALIANEIRSVLGRKIFNANLGNERASTFNSSSQSAFLDWVITEKPKNWLPKEFSDYASLLRQCEIEARQNLTTRLGADETKWLWGEANKIRFIHPLAGAPLIGSQFALEPLPLNGSSGSVNVGAAVSMRFIATPANWDLTRHVIPTGESGNPNSPHWKDQLNAWYTGNTPIFPFSNQAVKSATKEVLILSPQ